VLDRVAEGAVSVTHSNVGRVGETHVIQARHVLMPEPPGGLPTYRLRRVTEYIEINLDQALRLAELSTLVHMSPYHFARLFKQSTAMAPHRFVVRRRIDRATTLLAIQGFPIYRIAQSVGFRTASHFSTVFGRITGFTPSTYRTVRKGSA
jgi:AraC family transcriptional regulator